MATDECAAVLHQLPVAAVAVEQSEQDVRADLVGSQRCARIGEEAPEVANTRGDFSLTPDGS